MEAILEVQFADKVNKNLFSQYEIIWDNCEVPNL